MLIAELVFELRHWRERVQTNRPSRLPAIIDRLIVGSFIVLCGLIPAAFALGPREGEPVAVIRLMPRAIVPKALAETDTPLLWMSAKGHVIVLPTATAQLLNDLYRDGAFLVLAAAPLNGCTPASPAKSITGAHPL
ncbi:hypothetical protein [Methylobacterium komagatae]